MSDVQSKYWVFTLNNYTDETVRALDAFCTSNCSYATYGYEIGDLETPHIQGYLELSARTRFGTLKRSLTAIGLGRIHVERRAGTAQQASDYCHKEDLLPPFFFGQMSVSRAGNRSDLEALREDLKNAPLRQIAEEHFSSFLRYQRGINAFRTLFAPTRMWETEVQVLWGATGTGKTRRVYDTCGQDLYTHPGGPWFDGYDGQSEVLFDEFSGSYFALPYLLKLLDRYPLQVPIKGGFVSFVPRRIWITSNYAPEDWYSSAREEHVIALLRRLTEVTHLE